MEFELGNFEQAIHYYKLDNRDLLAMTGVLLMSALVRLMPVLVSFPAAREFLEKAI